MRSIKQTFLIFMLALALSVVAFGQKDDKKSIPKPPPPVIKPGEKPKSDDKPKKPNTVMAVWKQQETETT